VRRNDAAQRTLAGNKKIKKARHRNAGRLLIVPFKTALNVLSDWQGKGF
jgi:hypothetical protein